MRRLTLILLSATMAHAAMAAERLYTRADSAACTPALIAVEARCTGGEWRITYPAAADTVGFASLRIAPSLYLDGTDPREATVSLGFYADDGEHLVAERTLQTGLDFDGRWNSLAITFDADGARLMAGHKLPQTLLQAVMPRPVEGVCHVTGATDIEELIIEHATDTMAPLLTEVNPADIPQECVYEFLDRENDPKTARLGGKYTLALLPADDGHIDIIYLGGAQTNASAWHPGMLKGRLTPTIFTGRYRLTWFDAMGHPTGDECHATLEADHSLLTCTFPLLGATLRFARTPR